MVKLLCTTSANYQPVYDAFCASLEPAVAEGSVSLVINTVDLAGFDGLFGFGSDAWHRAIHSKLVFAIKSLEDAAVVAEGEYVVVSDADIQYLQPLRLPELVRNAEARNLDYYGMRENHADAYNGGFYILRNVERVRAFLTSVLETMLKARTKYADQEALNDLLKRNPHGLAHDKIETKYCVWGNKAPGNDTIFHHAVCTADTPQKLHQFMLVKKRWNDGPGRRPPGQA